jgi:hypothetical protein
LILETHVTGWTECAPLLVRERHLLSEVLAELRKLLPFNLLGLDTDNDSAFMNETVRDYCQATGVVFTRCRPYRKNDQAFVEQKNAPSFVGLWAIVVSRDCRPQRRWHGSMRLCGCS